MPFNPGVQMLTNINNGVIKVGGSPKKDDDDDKKPSLIKRIIKFFLG